MLKHTCQQKPNLCQHACTHNRKAGRQSVRQSVRQSDKQTVTHTTNTHSQYHKTYTSKPPTPLPFSATISHSVDTPAHYISADSQ